MPTSTQSFYDLPNLAERSAWLREENRRRCIEAQARKAAEGPKAEEEDWNLDPARVAHR